MSALKQDLSLAPQELNANTITTAGTDLGARVTTGDGRVYRYALGSATALVTGKAYVCQALDTTDFQNLAIAAAGTATFVVTTTTTVTLSSNQLSGGLLTVRDGANGGQGFTYRIKSHPAAAAATVAFTLEDPLQVGLTTSNHIDVTPNPYSGIVVSPGTGANGVAAGVAVTNGTSNGYTWIQTRGLANVLSDGAIPIGQNVTLSAAVAGAVAVVASGTQPIVGYAAITTTNAKYAPIFLTLE